MLFWYQKQYSFSLNSQNLYRPVNIVLSEILEAYIAFARAWLQRPHNYFQYESSANISQHEMYNICPCQY